MDRTLLSFVLAFLLSAATGLAQVESSHLTGIVTDAQGGVLPGVTVTATSPALTPLTHAAVSGLV